MKQTKINYAKEGKKIALEALRKGIVPSYHSNSIKKLQKYEIGTSKKINNVLEKLYNSMHEIANPIPIRIRKEESILNLENLLN